MPNAKLLEILSILTTDEYENCYDTLKEIAKDDHNGSERIIHPIKDEDIIGIKQGINFDSKFVCKFITKEEEDERNSNSDSLHSADLFHITNNSLNFIEFKNGKVKNEKKEIKLKAIEGLLILYRFLKKHSIIQEFKEIFNFNINYILILNSNKNKDMINCEDEADPNARNRKRLNISKKLARLYPDYNETYFKKIIIQDFPWFKENYMKKYMKEN